MGFLCYHPPVWMQPGDQEMNMFLCMSVCDGGLEGIII